MRRSRGPVGEPAAAASPIPLYYQVASVLQARIYSGQYVPGGFVGTEASLAGEFGVSRITIRQALARLDAARLVNRVRARGTFVSSNVPRGEPFELHGFIEDIMRHADVGDVADLNRSDAEANDELAIALGVPIGTLLVRFERVRQIHGRPVAYILNWLRPELGETITEEALRSESLLRLIDDTPGCRIAWGSQTMEACQADKVVARRLDVDEGSAVLSVRRTVHSTAQQALEVTRSWYPGGRPTFAVRLDRVSRA